MQPKDVKLINVSGKSSTGDLADLIIGALDSDAIVRLQSIGAGAVNQAVKGVAVAIQRSQFNLFCIPSFFNVVIDGQNKSGINLEVKKGE